MTRAILTTLLCTAMTPALAQPIDQGPKNVPDFQPAWETQTRAPAVDSGISLGVETVVGGLTHPWGIEVLPDGGYLVTERSGSLRVVSPDGALREAPVAGVPEVMSEGQGGLLDVALAEDFADSRAIYLSYAKPVGGGDNTTAVARGTLNADLTELTDVSDVFVQEPAYSNTMHYGSRVVPHDGAVYVTTGERSDEATRVLAQDLGTTYGKIVRIQPTGGAADGNPFAGQDGAIDTVYSYGHRNIQGAAIRPSTGQLWSLEHGPKGGDELNLVEAGANYGWPVISYGEKYSGQPVGSGEHSQDGMAEPQYYWDPVIAPGGFVFYDGDMFPEWNGDVIAASLSPGGINRLVLDGDRVSGEEKFLQDRGRIRDVEIDADGALLLLTDQPDGAILRVTPGGES